MTPDLKSRVERLAAISVQRGRGYVRVVLVGGDRAGKFIILTRKEVFPPATVITDVPNGEWYCYGRPITGGVMTHFRQADGFARDLTWIETPDGMVSGEMPVDAAFVNVWSQP